MVEVCEADETMRACAHSVNVLLGVLVVKRHASGEVRCNLRRHWCSRSAFGPTRTILLYVSIVLACRTVTVHPTLSRSHYFTYVFTVFSRHFRCGIYTFQIPGKPFQSGKTLLVGTRYLLAKFVHDECYVCPVLAEK